MAKSRSPVHAKFPKTIGECIDRMRELEVEGDKHRANAKLCDDAYNVLEAHLIETSTKNEITGASGKTATAKIEDHVYPSVEDWDVFHQEVVFGQLDAKKANALLRGPQLKQLIKMVMQSAQWDLLQKRVGVQAWRDRLNNKVVVKGTKVFTKLKLKLTAIKPGRR
jgi:hypothetical protein